MKEFNEESDEDDIESIADPDNPELEVMRRNEDWSFSDDKFKRTAQALGMITRHCFYNDTEDAAVKEIVALLRISEAEARTLYYRIAEQCSDPEKDRAVEILC